MTVLDLSVVATVASLSPIPAPRPPAPGIVAGAVGWEGQGTGSGLSLWGFLASLYPTPPLLATLIATRFLCPWVVAITQGQSLLHG